MKIRRFFFHTVLILQIALTLFGCSLVTPKDQFDAKFLESVRFSKSLAEKWLLNNFIEPGVFVYQYDIRSKSLSENNNMIRQLMASRLLAEMSQEDPDLRMRHHKNLDFIFRHWYRETKDGRGYIFYDQKAKLGSSTMALRTLVFSPFFREYTAQAQKLADGILSLMNEDGSFEPWFLEPNYAYNKDYLLTFYSGEAILSLVEYGLKLDADGQNQYFVAAQKSQDFYIDRYVTELERNYYPAYVPWHTVAMNKLYKATENEKYAEAIFTLNDKLLEIQDTTEYIGRFYNPETPEYGQPHVASDGVYTEGLAYAYEIALLRNDRAHVKKYRQALKIAVNNLQTLQYTAENIPPDSEQKRMLGGFFARVDAQNIRIDNVQHTLDAYRKILEVAQ